MKPIIIRPSSAVLSKYVQYFLFFSQNNGKSVSYTTFPNTNLCLAIYKQQSIAYINNISQNVCNVKQSRDMYTSRLYAFHRLPFHVNIEGNIDQVCIIFHPSALRAFSMEAYGDLLKSTNTFSDLFNNNELLERIFETGSFIQRSKLLESYLLKKIRYEIPARLKQVLHLISIPANETLSVKELSQKTGISEPTLYRLFISYLGQSPKAYLKTFRFRKSLDQFRSHESAAMKKHYLNEFYDQSHFIKEFKGFSGYTPRRFTELIAVEHNELVWVKKTNPL